MRPEPKSSPESIRSALAAALAGRNDVKVALLFGSHARGSATADSDIDVAVDAPGVDLFGLAALLTEVLDAEVDVVDVGLGDPSIPLLEEVVRDGIAVHEGIPGAAAIWRSRALACLETDRPWFARMRDAWIRRVAERGI